MNICKKTNLRFAKCSFACIVLFVLYTATERFLFFLIQELVQRYSEFINFPIFLWSSKEVDVEVEADSEEASEDEEEKSGLSLLANF